ncbi:hypothetical protein [Microcoleus sp. S13_B4]|uniref:hypothetical protein n=1 Tax=Microcoleus sp. S13_B4 TaxID=3055408 RepID=UPI002FCF0E29
MPRLSAIRRRKKEEGRRRKKEEGRRKREERRKKEEGGRRKKEELISCTIVNKAVRGGQDTEPTRILNYCGTGRKSC